MIRTLADCADVLTISDLCAVLRICEAEYYRLKAHGVFPIAPMFFGGHVRSVRYSKVAVQRYLESTVSPKQLRKVG